MNNPEGYVLVQVKQLAQWREWANNVAAWSTKADRSSEVARLKASISNAMISATQPTASNAGERELLNQALDALSTYQGFIDDAHILEGQWHWLDDAKAAEASIRAALASKPPQGEQKPVAEVLHDAKFGCKAGQIFIDLPVGTKLYSEPVAPPALTAKTLCGERGDCNYIDGLGRTDCDLCNPRSATPPAQAVQDSEAARDVLAERQRQISAEGWTPEHDDEHDTAAMAAAAGCYAFSAASEYAENTHWSNERFDAAEQLWPWDREWWKPSTPRRDLVKAGALIIAEIERLDRAARTRGNGVEPS